MLDKIRRQGEENGVEGLRMVSLSELRDMEPNISATAALYSPETGIVDSHALMEYFSERANNGGSMLAYNSEVTNIEQEEDGYTVFVKNCNEISRLKTKILINSAGLDSDRVAEMVGIDVEKYNYRIHYCKGQYFRLDGARSRMIKRLVYPVPKPQGAGLGIHATLDLNGSIRLGPDDEYMKIRNQDYSVDESKRPGFYESVRRFMPFIKEDQLSPDTSGIRPKLQIENGDFRDFVIGEESAKGFPGLINLIGVESPGLTASYAIAEYVGDLVRRMD